MTTLDPALTMLAAWLRPVLATVDAEAMEQCRTWVLALAESEDVYTEDLARAAFGHASADLVRTLETVIADATATYAPEGKSELVSHLAAATLLHLVDEGGTAAIDVVGRCESLLFLGWVPVISEMPTRLNDFASAQARMTRERIPLDATLKAVRRKTGTDQNELDETQRLAVTLDETQALLNRAVERLATVVDQFNDRLDLLDEEVDALWWARSERSGSTGQAWTDLDSLERTILASIDVANIVGSRRPTAGTSALLSQVIGTASETFELVDVVAALHQAGWSGSPADDDSRAPFRPLATGIALMKQFNNDTDVVAKALKASLSIPDGHKVTTSAVAHQLLNENALQDEDD